MRAMALNLRGHRFRQLRRVGNVGALQRNDHVSEEHEQGAKWGDSHALRGAGEGEPAEDLAGERRTR